MNRSTFRTLFAFLALVALVATAPVALAAKQDVEFKNRGTDTRYVLAAFGADGQCSDMPERQNLVIPPRESMTLASGESKVCWCTSKSGKISDCEGWEKAKAGKAVRLK
ncbi:MAG TPA: hypothetical protein VHQ65_16540 [Thermoanaerobaculia bacterium]|nr:hypothetical protein [Thermoanaerobaculia bacterium]